MIFYTQTNYHHICRPQPYREYHRPQNQRPVFHEIMLTFLLRDTQSLTESITAYRVENGRTYHAYRDGAYLFPNDQEEIDRLRVMHEIFRRIMGDKGHLAPWTQTNYPRRVLDIGTGTGEWCLDFAEEFPQTELIIGTDLSKIQPDETPPNVGSSLDSCFLFPFRNSSPLRLRE